MEIDPVISTLTRNALHFNNPDTSSHQQQRTSKNNACI